MTIGERDLLETVPASSQEALRELLGDLRHDLGKYVAFQLRWLPPEPGDEDLREALVADLARTRAAGDDVASAPALWDRFLPALVGQAPLSDGARVSLEGDPDICAIDEAIDIIRATLPELERAPRPELETARAAALEVASATKRLQRRARALAAS